MNYTTNYHLPQWEESDRVQMTDFNAAMASLEAGITSAQETADTAGGSGGTAQEAAEAAQSASDAAQQTANTALAKVNKAWSPDNRPYTFHSYTGAGGWGTFDLDVGFQPSMVIISGSNGQGGVAFYPATGFGQDRSTITWKSSGFSWGGSDAYYSYHVNGVRYYMMIWR